MELESKLSSVKVGGNKTGKKLSEIEYITNFHNSPEKIIKCYHYYLKMVHKSAYDGKHRKGHKTLIPK